MKNIKDASKDNWYLETVPKGTGRGFETNIVTDRILIATMNRHTSNSKGVLIYSKEQEANANLIITSVNNHSKLVAALEKVLSAYIDCGKAFMNLTEDQLKEIKLITETQKLLDNL